MDNRAVFFGNQKVEPSVIKMVLASVKPPANCGFDISGEQYTTACESLAKANAGSINEAIRKLSKKR